MKTWRRPVVLIVLLCALIGGWTLPAGAEIRRFSPARPIGDASVSFDAQWGASNYLTAWVPDDSRVLAAFVSPTGRVTPISGPIASVSDPWSIVETKVAWDGARFLVTWTEEGLGPNLGAQRRVKGRLVSSEGALLGVLEISGGDTLIGGGNCLDDIGRGDSAGAAGTFYVVWAGRVGFEFAHLGALIVDSPSGPVVGPPVVLADARGCDPGTVPEVASDGSWYFAVWRGLGLHEEALACNMVFGTPISPVGVPVVPNGEQLSFNHCVVDVDISFGATHYLVTWGACDTSCVVTFGAFVTPTGQVRNLASNFGEMALTPPRPFGSQASVGWDGSNFVVGWRDTTSMLRLETVSESSGAISPSIPVASAYPSVVVSDGPAEHQQAVVVYNSAVCGLCLRLTSEGDSVPWPVAAVADFGGDGSSDTAVFRPSQGTWYAKGGSVELAEAYGTAGDIPTPADYDGDARTDMAVFRPDVGTWYVKGSAGQDSATPYGTSGDIPTPGDYDGDGKADIAVFRPDVGIWYIKASTAGESAAPYGTAGDIPVPADYDGDGKTDIAVFRPSSGTWFVKASTAGDSALAYGTSGDVPAPADYDGDGKADMAVFRPQAGTWYLKGSAGQDSAVPYGTNGDIPVPADYDGDTKADIAVFRAGEWYVTASTAGDSATAYGTAGDVPLSAPLTLRARLATAG